MSCLQVVEALQRASKAADYHLYWLPDKMLSEPTNKTVADLDHIWIALGILTFLIGLYQFWFDGNRISLWNKLWPVSIKYCRTKDPPHSLDGVGDQGSHAW